MPSGQTRRTQHKECGDAGTFRLFGASCIDARPLAVDSSGTYQVERWWLHLDSRNQVRKFDTRHWVGTHPKGVGQHRLQETWTAGLVPCFHGHRQGETPDCGVTTLRWLASLTTYHVCGSTTVSCSQTGLQSVRTTHMRLWKSGGRTWTQWAGLSEKRPKTATPFTFQQHHLACNERGADSVSQRASGAASARRQTICNSHLHSSVRLNSRYLAPPGSWAGPGTRRATIITGDSRETTYLFQQLSVALQKGNS